MKKYESEEVIIIRHELLLQFVREVKARPENVYGSKGRGLKTGLENDDICMK